MQHFTTISSQIPHNNLSNQTTSLSTKVTADFQLSQEAWTQLNHQMNVMVKTEKPLRRQYMVHIKIDKCTETESQNISNTKKTFKKLEKVVRFVDDKTKNIKRKWTLIIIRRIQLLKMTQ